MKKELLTKSLIGLVVAVIMVGCVWQGLSWFGKIGEDTIAKATTEQSTTQDAETNRNDESSLEAEGSQAAGTEETEAVTTIAMTEDEETESSTETTESIETTGKESTVTETTKSKATKAAKAEGSASKTTKKAESSAAVKTTEAVSTTQATKPSETHETAEAAQSESSTNPVDGSVSESETSTEEINQVSDEALFEYEIYDGKAYITAYLGEEEKVIIPETLGNMPVTVVMCCAFEDNENLIELVLPSGCRSVENWAFGNCINLKSVTVPEGLTIIGESAFENCSSLTEISLPSTLVLIGSDAFLNTGLTSVEIPDSVVDQGDNTGIGSYAFGYNYDGERLNVKKRDDFNVIGSQGSEAQNYALKHGLLFNGEKIEGFSCSVDSETGNLYITGYFGEKTEIVIPAELYGKTVYGVRGFDSNKQIRKVVISEGISVISRYAFLCSSIEEIVISDSVTSIGDYAFINTNLKEIEIPYDMCSIGKGALGVVAFRGAEDLIDCETWEEPSEKLLVQYMDPAFNIKGSAGSNAEQYAAYNGLLFNGTKTTIDYVVKAHYKSETDPESADADAIDYYEIKKYIGKGGDVVVPASYNGYLIKQIGSDAFRNCETITSLVLSDEITSIGTAAFCGCTNLTSVVLDSKLEHINEGAFGDCTSLLEVEVPENTKLWSFCFGCIFGGYPEWGIDYYDIPNGYVDGFNIIGVPGSSAEEYAKENHFLFNGNEV